ncbi:DUF5686 and carboxypeptidase regulatory-like domain-containing protein [Gillisia sp. M10.2A]|uniref:DUF5686 and carboxypeptidase regulatory-like domain-containing protein n=1 Tax=Gillisia lutea TaxID=2909668 RepID=A0ABS9EDK1_9FLAO|nr:DUF5686 and carboxypeptidase regulatory-like domain-containing protein [Gillisia lutea]MCF4100952.1 DUF5686 and carboxypeptidase regulatory-like domain-containing protein [Gillisia lutea]
MSRKFWLFISFSFFFHLSFSQITGKVANAENEALPYVNIYTEDGVHGTTSNEEGIYQLKINQPGTYQLVFQYLGYVTLRKQVDIKKFPFVLDVQLKAETTNFEEVTLNSKDNPANRIIRNAIEFRKENLARIEQYTANYYSRGLWRIKNAPEKILGQDLGDLGGGLDSTRSGIIYLSETVSEIAFKAPNDFKEKVIASKVSGNDNGFSLNSARESDFSFYDNTIDINAEIVSPIAEYAFNYYNYKLEGVFYDDAGHLINKIEVIPKRPKDRVFWGIIYIVEDSWQIFGVELKTTGQAIQVAPIENLIFTQNYKYSETYNFWIKISQTVDFSFSMFGIGGDGRFTAVYSNYNFRPQLNETSFSREIMSFAEASNKKDSLYWRTLRPVPLTSEELNDYIKKDSLQEIRSSKKYLDSVDAAGNKFTLASILFGYNYSKTYRKQNFNISSPIFGSHFNTVQGWNPNVNISYRQDQDENYGKYWRLFSSLNYGFDEDRLRIKGGFQKRFNNLSRPTLTVRGGVETAQINSTQPISERINDITSLFFERNYLKLYERTFAEIAYQQEVLNGVTLLTDFSYQDRNALFNTTDQTWNNQEDIRYSSNDPLQPSDFTSAPFEDHHIFKFNFTTKINFAQQYMSYPDRKIISPSNKYPTLYLSYEKGLGSNIAAYNFDQLKAAVTQDLSLGNKGTFSYTFKGGTFLTGEASYIDYQHFNGNQTRIGTGNYTNKFHLLPYYALSTNSNYFEGHMEQDFKGWILGKIPGVNQLNYNLILGAHFLSTENNKPYSEVSIGIDNLGFGKYRLLRLDYVRSNFNGKKEGAFIFGLKFLNILD